MGKHTRKKLKLHHAQRITKKRGFRDNIHPRNEKAVVVVVGHKKKSRNCHPQVIGKTISQDSCLTPAMLEKIKHKYNEKSHEHKIVSENPEKIYDELKAKSYCHSERCIIKKALGNKHLFDLWIKEIEAPEHPNDWKKNPNEWLSNVDIHLVMKQYEKTYPEFLFLGPTSINFDERVSNGRCVGDDICHSTLRKFLAMNPSKRKIGIVFNLSRNDQPGSHWVSLFFHFPFSEHGGEISQTEMGGYRHAKMGEEKCKKILDKSNSVIWDENTPYAFFFDSGGADAPQQVLNMICRFYQEWEEIKPVGSMSMQYDDNHRTNAEHQFGGTECGMYSLFFIITMLTGICGGKAAMLNARRLKKRDICPKDFQLRGEQEKRDYFLSHGKWNHKRIPDRFVQEFRSIYFNPKMD